MIPTLSLLVLLAIVVSAVSTILLYIGALPVRGAVQWVGGGQTEADIKASERQRKRQAIFGFGLLGLFVIAQAVLVWRDKAQPATHDVVPRFELQGFAVSYEEHKESYGRDVTTIRVDYRGRGNLVLVSPSPPDGHHYEVWLRFKSTCGKETGDMLQQIIVLNGTGEVSTYCGGIKTTYGGGDLPQQPPTYEWGSVVAYRELGSAPLALRK